MLGKYMTENKKFSRAVRYIIETDEDYGLVIYEGRPTNIGSGIPGSNSTTYDYTVMYQGNQKNPDEDNTLNPNTKTWCLRHQVKISRPYKTWEDFVADHIELFL